MTAGDTALAWARARSAGPLPVPARTPAPAGMIKLTGPGGSWLVPRVPESADARVLAEMGLPGPLLEQPNDTARMLAAVLRCCWEDPLTPVWPGGSAGSGPVLAVFRAVTGPRDEAAHRRAAVAALRRLDQAGWVRWDEAGRYRPAGAARRVVEQRRPDHAVPAVAVNSAARTGPRDPGPPPGARRPGSRRARRPGSWARRSAGASTMTSIFEPVLADLSERHRDEILAAFAAVENSPEPVPEAVATALRDATLRRSVEEMLNLIGRTLVRAGPGRWTSGYRDDIAARLTAGGGTPCR